MARRLLQKGRPLSIREMSQLYPIHGEYGHMPALCLAHRNNRC